WPLIFWALGGAAALSLLLTAKALPETLAPQDRVRVNPRNLWAGCKTLFRDPVFMGLTFIGGFGFASFMVFIASASFVYAGHFGLNPTQFSLAFAINAVGFFAASQAAGPLSERLGILRVIRWAAVWFAGFTLLLLAIAMAGQATLGVIIAGLFLANACLGLIIPTTMVMALDPHGAIAGLASSLGGTLQVVSGALIVVLTGFFFDGTALPMIAAIALCAALTLTITLLTLHKIELASHAVTATRSPDTPRKDLS
ncbi:MFS transporter, DHA1 family, bicyclomycin/chloramphenicol resistance protein, partial [Jannaschia pohangensis]